MDYFVKELQVKYDQSLTKPFQLDYFRQLLLDPEIGGFAALYDGEHEDKQFNELYKCYCDQLQDKTNQFRYVTKPNLEQFAQMQDYNQQVGEFWQK